MFNEIFANLWIITIFAVILACLIVANIISGLFYSIGGKKDNFDPLKLRDGIFKGLVVLGASYLITIALTAIPYAVAMSGVDIDQASLNAISILVLFLIWGWAIMKYALAALENIRKIFGVSINKKE